MLDDVLKTSGDILAWNLGLPLLAFMVSYAKDSPWRADPLGIERMFKMGWMFFLWILIMAGNFLPDAFDTARLIVRVAFFALIVVALWMQYVNLRRVQKRSAKPLFFTWLTYRAQAERRARREDRSGQGVRG